MKEKESEVIKMVHELNKSEGERLKLEKQVD
jgi:hypothetical protein